MPCLHLILGIAKAYAFHEMSYLEGEQVEDGRAEN